MSHDDMCGVGSSLEVGTRLVPGRPHHATPLCLTLVTCEDVLVHECTPRFRREVLDSSLVTAWTDYLSTPTRPGLSGICAPSGRLQTSEFRPSDFSLQPSKVNAPTRQGPEPRKGSRRNLASIQTSPIHHWLQEKPGHLF